MGKLKYALKGYFIVLVTVEPSSSGTLKRFRSPSGMLDRMAKF